MPVNNSDIARIFKEIADLLEIKDANPFRVRAYRTAAATVERHSQDVTDMLEEEQDLTKIEGIGEDLAQKIEEIANTGKLQQLEDLKQEVSPDLAELMAIPGLGGKRVQQLHEELGISTVEELEQAAEQGDIQDVSGFGEKTEQNILENISRIGERRTKFRDAERVVGPLVEYLEAHQAVQKIAVAGSYRRRKETVGDLDIVIVSTDGEAVSEHFVAFEDADEIVSQGKTRSTVILRSGLQVDIRIVEEKSFGAALHYFTGSKAHNVTLRQWALERDLKINEYGIWDDDEQIAGATEAEMYATFNMPIIPPELRENRGELEAAQADNLPELITVDDIRGDLHAHTTYSDGSSSLEEMARVAQKQGYAYLAITDHSPHIAVTQGVDAEQLAQQIDAIDRLNESFDDFRLLKSVEVDILEDGSLDLPDEILKRLDLRVCAIHSHFNLPRQKQTERLLRAMDSPYFNILAHPTGRRIGVREPIEIDMERVMEVAVERGCYLEINADPDRLDLDDARIKMAKEIGLKLVISTDSHQPAALQNMRFGVYQARRGWLTADDVLNTLSWHDLQGWLERS